MAAFDDLRRELTRSRAETERVRAELLLAREAVKRGRRDRIEHVKRLEIQERGLAERGDDIWKRFEPFMTPQEGLSRLDDRHPILLFPLRLETRFKTGAQGQPQLWVRVYPDDCLIDTFEPALTEQEVANAEAFWAAIWRAGGVETDERAAWRELSASHGQGRAGWIVQQYKPLNPPDAPLKADASDVLLVIRASEPVPAETVPFWREVWLAGGTAAAIADSRPDLEERVGRDVAALIVERLRPVNLADGPVPPNTREGTTLQIAVQRFPPAESLDLRRSSWSSAPKVNLLPERFVLIGSRGGQTAFEAVGKPIRTPLAVGPDPNAPPDRQLKPDGDDLQIPEELAWMFDFEAALERGMAFRVDLNADQAATGVDRLFVLGVRISDDAALGRKELEELLAHHLYSRAGFEILPQGTPTNNTEQGSTSYAVHGDPASGYTAFFRNQPLYAVESDPLLRRDGQRLAEGLGIDHALVQRFPNADGTDQIDARAMHAALWPATIGYAMRTMLRPVFDEAQIAATRDLFIHHVVGRGSMPAVRIGPQPYGILPVTAWDKVTWFDPPSVPIRPSHTDPRVFLRRVLGVLRQIEHDWEPLFGQLSCVGRPGSDPHQTLLDVLGLHPSSVEYYPLTADSMTTRFHALALLSFPVAMAFLQSTTSKADAMQLLRRFGYAGAEEPDALSKLYSSRQPRLDGPVVDERKLSETEPLAPCAAGRNYIEWLLDGIRTNIDIVQEQRGFDGNSPPRALLYLWLRHAVQLVFHQTGVRERARLSGMAESPVAYVEPAFVHVSAASAQSESRYAVLHDTIPERGNVRMADFISRNLGVINPEMAELIGGLDRLAGKPTARLERAVAEHVDCASYRLDAWKQGLLHAQLERLRQSTESPGVYVGAFGWLEEVRPRARDFTAVRLPDDIDELINRPGDPPLVRDSANLGLIHAPSLNQATTAAVLRSGYHAEDGGMAVDLSSRRVRLALDILEGMRTGQPLGALLGYHFERHLHDSGSLSLRALVFGLRRKFPLVANRIQSTKDDAASIDTIAAMNVVDGLKLVQHVAQSTIQTYPWGAADLPSATDPSHGPAIDAAVAYVRDINDAVADLALAEGVHQAVLGNFDRAAGTLDAFAKGGSPPEVEVVRTPRSGMALVLRTAIHLDPEPPGNPVPAIARTPLAVAEPRVNGWLADRLPAATIAGCSVTFTSRTTGVEEAVFVRQQDLELQPIDIVYQFQTRTDQALHFLDDRILQFVHTAHAPQLDAPLRIDYTRRVDQRITFFELQALIESLRTLVVTSRPLQPADLVRQIDARAAEQPPSTIDLGPLGQVRDSLATTRLIALTAVIANLSTGTIDAAISAFTGEISRLATFRLPQTGIGFAYEWRSGMVVTVKRKLRALVTRLRARADDAGARLADFDGNPGLPEEDKRQRLRQVEPLVSTSYLSPEPASVTLYRSEVGAKLAAFEVEVGALDAIGTTRFATLDALILAVDARDLTQFDVEGLSLDGEKGEVARFRQQLVTTAQGLKTEVENRIAAADDLIASGPLSLDQIQRAAKLLLGDDFQMIPSFVLPARVGQDVANAWDQSIAGDLTRHLTEASGRDFPVDDWLHGVARVRDRMRHWENTILLADAFGRSAPEPIPLQLPFEPNASWCALEMPPSGSPPGEGGRDRLLYTAHFTKPFDATRPVCGLLVDEWTEVVPDTQETTGIAFHFDRPGAEAPQSWLLALPAVMNGHWSWDELIEAVNGAFDAAKRRAIEPAHIASTVYSWLLPATFAAYTFPEISISNYLLRNVNLYASVKGG